MKKSAAIGVFAIAALLVSGAAFAQNSLAVTAGAALFGSNFGLAVTNDGSSNDVYVSSTHPANENVFRFKFRIFPATLASPIAFNDYLIGFVRSETGTRPWFIPIYLRRQNTYWTIQTNVRLDNNSFPAWQNAVKICGDAGTPIPCTNYAHGVLFEFIYTASSAPGANDGSLVVKREGVQSQNWTGLDTDQRLVTEIRWGAIFQDNAANRPPGNGTYYFDAFESYRTAN